MKKFLLIALAGFVGYASAISELQFKLNLDKYAGYANQGAEKFFTEVANTPQGHSFFKNYVRNGIYWLLRTNNRLYAENITPNQLLNYFDQYSKNDPQYPSTNMTPNEMRAWWMYNYCKQDATCLSYVKLGQLSVPQLAQKLAQKEDASHSSLCIINYVKTYLSNLSNNPNSPNTAALNKVLHNCSPTAVAVFSKAIQASASNY